MSLWPHSGCNFVLVSHGFSYCTIAFPNPVSLVIFVSHCGSPRKLWTCGFHTSMLGDGQNVIDPLASVVATGRSRHQKLQTLRIVRPNPPKTSKEKASGCSSNFRHADHGRSYPFQMGRLGRAAKQGDVVNFAIHSIHASSGLRLQQCPHTEGSAFSCEDCRRHLAPQVEPASPLTKNYAWEFPYTGGPHYGCFVRENAIKKIDLGGPPFMETFTSACVACVRKHTTCRVMASIPA